MRPQNVDNVTKRVVLPAEHFYNSSAECYVDNTTFETFLPALRARLGDAWDDRLTQPAKVFFAPARTASAVVGAGRFFGGAIRLGRAKLHTAIDQLMERWEQVLGATEDAVDRWLPERDGNDCGTDVTAAEIALVSDMLAPSSSSAAQKAWESAGAPIPPRGSLPNDDIDGTLTEYDSDDLCSLDQFDGSPTPVEDDEFDDVPPVAPSRSVEPNTKTRYMDIGDVHLVSNPIDGGVGGGGEVALCTSLSRQKRRRVSEIASKLTRRVRQCIPSVTEIGGGLKEQLVELAWFQRVDEILQQNVVVRSLGGLARPAEHFYETATSTFLANKRSAEQFVSALQNRLGSAWDERLKAPASSFYTSAILALGGNVTATKVNEADAQDGDVAATFDVHTHTCGDHE